MGNEKNERRDDIVKGSEKMSKKIVS